MGMGDDFLDIYSPPKIISKGVIYKANGESVSYVIELG